METIEYLVKMTNKLCHSYDRYDNENENNENEKVTK